MENGKVNQIINRCNDVFDECRETLKWCAEFIKEHPHINDKPHELISKISSTQLELFDINIMLENIQSSLGKNTENM